MSNLVHSFLDHTRQEDARLASNLEKLGPDGDALLAGVLGRFDRDGSGSLGARERLDARRVLNFVRLHSTETLAELNKILDYLDLNANAKLEISEVELTLEIFDHFSKIDSENTTLSLKELRMLYAVLRHLDADDSHSLELEERRKLRHSLERPAAFIEEQKKTNPLLQAILAE